QERDFANPRPPLGRGDRVLAIQPGAPGGGRVERRATVIAPEINPSPVVRLAGLEHRTRLPVGLTREPGGIIRPGVLVGSASVEYHRHVACRIPHYRRIIMPYLVHAESVVHIDGTAGSVQNQSAHGADCPAAPVVAFR